MVAELIPAIQARIQSFLEEVKSPQVLKMVQNLGQGKMLRSQLILAICSNHPQIVDFCAIIEMIQSASLLHDDVIDHAQTRRGNPSLNATFGNTNAIMLGDVFYSKAFCELANFSKEIVQLIAQSVVELSRGEIKDVQGCLAFNPNKAIYLDTIEDKSASLIAASSCGAALLQGLEPSKYRDFGRHFGMAFQMVDDLLDITQSQEVLGKPALSDFKEGKSTLPYILLHQKLNPADQKKLASYFKVESEEVQEWCLEKFKEFGIAQEVLKEARGYVDLALEAINGEDNVALERMASAILERTF
ncbi:polyprenyl synthetase family protein [Helicobacter suis]|uniref:Octaprenyl-diphosphate synthase IspB n=1 Tax=Helicobacter suis TaxID=104628 RepID=A0A6J4CYU0_9HELI|nr:polyprenyl synthetase family protein [Helicobacter suis]EFX42525.1 putative octaprenyl-diphosphate synthase [Helicobacter suis HS1]BCD69863.1 Octaprenyl-diphosphate synthase IspB [Helicobacter suis]BDR28472.1 octaprenyl-diphosphate synthase [Helicobacter suis HS1]